MALSSMATRSATTRSMRCPQPSSNPRYLTGTATSTRLGIPRRESSSSRQRWYIDSSSPGPSSRCTSIAAPITSPVNSPSTQSSSRTLTFPSTLEPSRRSHPNPDPSASFLSAPSPDLSPVVPCVTGPSRPTLCCSLSSLRSRPQLPANAPALPRPFQLPSVLPPLPPPSVFAGPACANAIDSENESDQLSRRARDRAKKSEGPERGLRAFARSSGSG